MYRARFQQVPLLATVLLISAPLFAGPATAVTFSDGTFLNGDWTATKDFDSTPSSNATFAAYQVLAGGNPGAFREIDHVWTGPGGFVVDQFQVVAIYAPAVNGPIGAINSSFDLEFLGGSAGTSQVGYEVILKQNGSVYFSPRSLAVALGPGNGAPGPWVSFGSSGLTAADFRLLVGSGPATPDFSSAGAPIQFGYLTMNASDHAGIESTQSGIDNWSLTVVGAAPTVDLLDPVPDLLEALTQPPEQAKAIVAQSAATVRGVAADGVARVVVRVSVSDPGTVELTLVDAAGTPLVPPGEAGFLTRLGDATGSNRLFVPTVEVPEKGSMAFAVYQAPSDFVRARSGDANARNRQVSLQVRFTPQTGGAPQEATTPITIARPPVVLVHGLWGSQDSWNGFVPLITDIRFVVKRINYATNAAGFAVNTPIVSQQIRARIKAYKAASQVAAVQADLVTHSMGGNLVRMLPLLGNAFFRDDNFEEGDVHKLINIGTPHFGSELAARLLTKVANVRCRVAFSSAGVPIDEGAIHDLSPGSAALRKLNQFVSPLRLHNNVGIASQRQKEVNATGTLISVLQSPLVCGRILPKGGFDAVFRDANDLVVSAPSQRARLSPSSLAVSTFTPLIHTRAGGVFDVADGGAELESEEVSQEVINLLNLSVDDATFIRLSPP